MTVRKCKTPGASYYFSIGRGRVDFSITWIPEEVLKRLGAGQKLRRALHDAAEDFLASKWLTSAETARRRRESIASLNEPSTFIKMPRSRRPLRIIDITPPEGKPERRGLLRLLGGSK